MRRKRILGLATIGLVFSLALAGCTGSSKGSTTSKNTNEEGYPVTISTYDQSGKEFQENFESKPKRVISTNQTTTEIMLDLDLQDSLVGTSFMDSPILPRLEDKYRNINVLSETYPSKEAVLALNPDLIMGWKSVFSDKNLGSVESWNEKGVKTFIQRNSGISKEQTLDDVYYDINDIGKIFNIEEKSTKYVDDMKERINNISEKIKSVKEPMKVLVIEGEGENKYRVYGPKTLVSDMVSKAGGTNVAKESGSVGVENIIEMNPDAIVLIHYLNQNKDNKEEKALLENPALKNVTAIKENKIIYTPLSETYAGGARTVEGIERIAKGLYPDLLK
ncbi:ABC transporter substrate-binding protein [Clostridium perfringens]|uniref:ABC transporter substrate-binding protein n=1 Tax=Clostridium perfringens TaxID=1502 RepID=UPI001094B216|nr:ABC transporter substrate-binding protein [Clostridium perfringens]TGY46638.1 ABC transporter substrate-binding protein [Clostridium perfringens]